MEKLKQLVKELEKEQGSDSPMGKIYNSDILKKYDDLIKEMFPNKTIIYVNRPTFYINKIGDISYEPIDEYSYVSTDLTKMGPNAIKQTNIYIYSLESFGHPIFDPKTHEELPKAFALRNYSTSLEKTSF